MKAISGASAAGASHGGKSPRPCITIKCGMSTDTASIPIPLNGLSFFRSSRRSDLLTLTGSSGFTPTAFLEV